MTRRNGPNGGHFFIGLLINVKWLASGQELMMMTTTIYDDDDDEYK